MESWTIQDRICAVEWFIRTGSIIETQRGQLRTHVLASASSSRPQSDSVVSSSAIIGPCFFEDEDGEAVTVNSQRYRHMLQMVFVPEFHELQENENV
ncbi:hypothetical protein ANN_16454 [Periplaneta americana]|uniref:Uncharacterized protein n=1 Tax=Periplaneta americana TaxID=6978 RepID=A0ABQ8SJT6_PERAM|nr:hypothetical protein ANN_16454 [Periplaneta americana]